jgi:hypothetical protein
MMKRIFVLGTTIATAALLVPSLSFAQGHGVKREKVSVTSAQRAKAEKVEVCHVTGNGSYQSINISKSAVQAHMDHGDAMPGSLVGNKYVNDDCGVEDTVRAESPSISFGALAWGGWSCPAGTTVVGGGYEPAEATVLVSEVAAPDSASGLYPKYPHYTFVPPETGWVVQNGSSAQTLTVYAICVAE